MPRNHVTHGLRKHPLYSVWDNMKARCYRIKNNRYHNYGARGITVCDQWKNSFENFYNWAINNGYTSGLTLDRIDNNKNYTPSNCRFVDNRTQCNNRTSNVYIEYNNERHTIAEWSSILNLPYKKLWKILKNNNYDLSEIYERTKGRG